jgi:DNA-binding transcriptional ArsR family regulator
MVGARARVGSKGPYWVTRKDQLDGLASAIRLDIVDRLAALGPMSVRRLSASMRKKPTAIYHHLEQMVALDLVRRTSVSGSRGRPAAVYEAAGVPVRLSLAPADAVNRNPMGKIARIVARQAAKEYALGFNSHNWRIEGRARNHWQFRCLMQPSAKRLARINALFDELASLIWTPDPSPGKQLISVAWFHAPLDGPRPRDRKGIAGALKRRPSRRA